MTRGPRDFDLVGNSGHLRLQRHERRLDRSLLDDRSDRRTINQREIVLVFRIGGMDHAANFDLRISQYFTAELGG